MEIRETRVIEASSLFLSDFRHSLPVSDLQATLRFIEKVVFI